MAAEEAKTAVEEKQTNCLGCNKPLKKVRIYYRDNKFYCTKRCWLKKKNEGDKKEGK